jgi:hypothetical protein
MSVSDWLTIIGIILAIFAFYSSSERNLIALKLCRYEILSVVSILLFVLYLIKFDEIVDTITLLKIFIVPWGFKANNWALIVFLITIGYSSMRLFYSLPNKASNENTISFYLRLMRQNFDDFYKLFLKFEKKAAIKEFYSIYKRIIFDPRFLIEISKRNPYYHTELFISMDENSFRPYFSQLVNDSDSIYYQEIELNDSSNFVQDYNAFLFELLHNNTSLFIDIGGLKILKDWYLKHLQNERIKGRQSNYHQPTELVIDNYKFTLPIYYHISFIGLVYNEAIIEKIDISTLSVKYTNMQSIFSSMIEKIIENIDREIYLSNLGKEYPTNYHFIISKIFGIIGDWLERFNEDDNFNNKSSFITFFSFCFGLCANELFKGYKNGKISQDFIVSRYHYDLLGLYFDFNLKKELESEINEKCLKIIPKEFIEPILSFSLNERLALSYTDFSNKDFTFPPLKDYEVSRLNGLYDFLNKNNLLN